MGLIANPGRLFSQFATTADDYFLRVRDIATQPENAKAMRTYGIEQAAAMIGRTAQAIRTAEKDPESGLVELYGETPRDHIGRRYYTIERIQQYRKHFRTAYVRPAGSSMLVCAVTIFKGGAAKTTTAVHLAVKCAIDGFRTLLIDLDSQASATQSLGIIPAVELDFEDTITDTLLENPGNLRSIVRPTYVHGLHLVPGNLGLQSADLLLPNPARNNSASLGPKATQRLAAALSSVEDEYDVVIMDLGPNMGALTLNALYAANALLIPIPPGMNDFGSSALYFNTMAEMFQQENWDSEIDYMKILITKHSGNWEAVNTEAMIRLAYGNIVLAQAMPTTVELERQGNNFSTLYEAHRAKTSPEAFKRAMEAMESVNNEIIEGFKEVWAKQAIAAGDRP